VWRFTTEAPPEKVAHPDPPDDMIGVLITTDISWAAGVRADSYDVYFGTLATAVANATHGSPEFIGNQTGLIPE